VGVKQSDHAPAFLYYWRVVSEQEREHRAWPWAEPVGGSPAEEHRFAASQGRDYRFDWCWPDRLVAVEVDGGQNAPRGGRHASDEDRAKLNLAASLGWRVLRFSPKQLETDPYACVLIVARALAFTP